MSLLEVRNLKTYYFLEAGGVVKAVDDVSFEVNRGEPLGLVGESGCGKTTAAMSIMRLIEPPGRIVEGEVLLDGDQLLEKTEEDMREIRWKRISVVFQGALNALNPVIKVGDQIAEAVMLHERGVGKGEALERAAELLELVGIERKRVNHYPFEFSGGMKQRTMIAMALACNPELIILDEPATALDVIVEAQVISLLRSLEHKLDLNMMLITHDFSLVSEICRRVAVMYAGKIVEYADILAIYKKPLHPYTQGLVRAFPRVKEAKRQMFSIPGFPPDLVNPPSGCRFHPRCAYTKDVCRVEEPKIMEVKGRHYVACHLIS